MAIKLITVADDRSGRKGGQYGATQSKINNLLCGWIDQYHYKLGDFIDCDPLMAHTDAAKNGRVYKPWCIYQSLLAMQDGDYLIYNDCSPELWNSPIDLRDYDLRIIQRLADITGIMVGFVKYDDCQIGPGQLGRHTHRYFTPDNLLADLGAEKLADSFLCASGMICIRKSPAILSIIERWLNLNREAKYCAINVDETEDNYYSGEPGSKWGHRHDQSILSLLLNMHGWKYVDILYNEMNPYNFLNFCRPGVEYKFIKSNP